MEEILLLFKKCYLQNAEIIQLIIKNNFLLLFYLYKELTKIDTNWSTSKLNPWSRVDLEDILLSDH